EPEAPVKAPPSPDYVLGPEHPPSPGYVHGPEEPKHAPLSLDYVPEPEYPEYLVSSDAKAPMEDQPLPDDASPTALSPGYIVGSDPKEDLEEDPADYPTDGGDNADDDSSEDNDDEDDDDEEQEASEDDDEEEKEKHPALANSSVVPVVNLVSSAEDIEAIETDESAPTSVPSPRRRTARISIRPQIPMSDTTEALIAEYASTSTPPSPPPSPLTKIWLIAASPPTHHPSEIQSPPLLLPSTTHIDDLPEADMPLRKKAHFTAHTGRFEDGGKFVS
ncbi:hypothetical protein Tco_1471458, partial [Tanacetum coccineum]